MVWGFFVIVVFSMVVNLCGLVLLYVIDILLNVWLIIRMMFECFDLLVINVGVRLYFDKFLVMMVCIVFLVWFIRVVFLVLFFISFFSVEGLLVL